MQVRELIELLNKQPQDAHVVIGGEVVHGIELYKGKLEIGYYNPRFNALAKGNDLAVMFLANSELSDGSVESTIK